MSDEPVTMSDNVIPLTGSIEASNDAARHAETLLLVRVRDNADREAYRELFEAFIPRLRAYARNQGSDAGTAENVVQDVMVTAWTRAHLFDPDKASARTWIYTLVRNRLIDQHRAGERRQRAYDGYASTFTASTTNTDSAEQALTGSRIATLLTELPDEQAQAVLMIYIEGKSHREIAEELDVPIGTIKSRTRLALQRLRKLMEDPA